MRQRFEQLVDEHGGRLIQLAELMLRSRAEAEDVAQDCLLKLWTALPKLPVEQELPWLITCTRNACLDRLRRQRRRGELLHGAEQQMPGSQPIEQPEWRHVRGERARQLHAAIAALPEPGRSLLILRDIQDLPVADVARALALSENQVKVYCFRARRALRQAIEHTISFEEMPDEHVA